MSDTQTLRCRLCALAKPYSQLVNLDDDKKRMTLQKLSRLRIVVTDLDSVDDELAKTVCALCITSLDNAFDFVMRVEAAQSALNVNRDVKREINKVITCKSTDINEPVACSNEHNLLVNHKSNNFNKVFLEYTNDKESLKDSTSFESDVYESESCPILNQTVIRKEKLKSTHLRPCKNDKNTLTSKNDGKGSTDETSMKLSSWKDYSWMCAYCDTLFPCSDEMRKHSMQVHGCCNVYRCIDCKSKKFHLDKFIRHVNTHRKHLSLSCYKCHLTFSTIKTIKNHKESHFNSKHKCYGCNETFQSQNELTEHKDMYKKEYKHPLPSALQQLADDITCIKCQKTFCNKTSLRQHLLRHLDRPRDYICDKCGKRFITKGQIAEHMTIHEDVKQHQCLICKKTFRTLSHLREHVGVHDAKKPFACDQCGKRFRLQRYLNSHISIHTNTRPWICNICHKSFRFRCKLNDHKRQHTGEKPYLCKICQRRFTNWPNYHKHLRRRHGQVKSGQVQPR